MLVDGDVELSTFASLHAQDVPEDCSLLIIAGPSTKFGREELERLNTYLARGGRVLALFPYLDVKRPQTGLEGLLANWNIEVGQNVVQDRANSKANGDPVVVATKFGLHPITRALLRSSSISTGTPSG